MKLSELEWAEGWVLRERGLINYENVRHCPERRSVVAIVDTEDGAFLAWVMKDSERPRQKLVSELQVVALSLMTPGEVWDWAWREGDVVCN